MLLPHLYTVTVCFRAIRESPLQSILNSALCILHSFVLCIPHSFVLCILHFIRSALRTLSALHKKTTARLQAVVFLYSSLLNGLVGCGRKCRGIMGNDLHIRIGKSGKNQFFLLLAEHYAHIILLNIVARIG